MKTYLSSIIPRIQKFSKKLDDLTIIKNQPWILLDELGDSKTIYIFLDNNELIISKNGIVTNESWRYVSNNSLVINVDSQSFLFKHGFLDENIFVLRLDSTEKYLFFLNENKSESEINTIEDLTRFLKNKYFNNKVKITDNKIYLKIIEEQKEFDFKSILDKRNENLLKSINNFKFLIDDFKINRKLSSKLSKNEIFLRDTLKNADTYMEVFSSINFPFYVALELDKRNIELDEIELKKLESISNERFNKKYINDAFYLILKEQYKSLQ